MTSLLIFIAYFAIICGIVGAAEAWSRRRAWRRAERQAREIIERTRRPRQ